MKFTCLMFLTLLYCTMTWPMLKEFIWEALPYPRTAACLCMAKANSACRTKKICPNLFVSPIKFQDKESSKPIQDTRYLGLFLKQSFLKNNKIGGISYSYADGNSGYIGNIFLDADYRGKGLGYLLLQHALSEMDQKNVQQVSLAVGDWNHCAIGLYKKCNFLVHKRVNLGGGNIMLRTHPCQNASLLIKPKP